MARYVHKETTESGVVGYGVVIERPTPMVRRGGRLLVRPEPARVPSIEVAGPEDVQRLTQGRDR
jgi:hypothetical protein